MKKLLWMWQAALPPFVRRQKHRKTLLQNDPLIGKWEFKPQLSSVSNQLPVLFGAQTILLAEGCGQCTVTNIELPGKPESVYYFEIRKDNDKLYGRVTRCNNNRMKAQMFSFLYRYQEEMDLFLVIVKREVYCFTRVLF